jgi:hypothetical protein
MLNDESHFNFLRITDHRVFASRRRGWNFSEPEMHAVRDNAALVERVVEPAGLAIHFPEMGISLQINHLVRVHIHRNCPELVE